jgi:uncharacterized protein YdhG (YjbR/CyaY superfamily)
MISEAKTVDQYMDELPRDRIVAMQKLRALCNEILVGYTEAMVYGGPGYQKDKGIEIGFASQKNYIGFYCMLHQVMLDNKAWLEGFNHGKGVIRFSNANKIDFELITKLLVATIDSQENPC